MDININDIDDNVSFSIKIIEEKPHAKFIRYLLTKEVLPSSILKELGRLGLSKPSEKQLIDYYINIVDPLVVKYKLIKYYKNYKNRLLKIKGKAPHRLNFTVNFAKDDTGRVAFCRMVKELEVDEMWSNEITKHYGSIHDIPQDETGERIIKVNITHKAEKILISPRRYIIDSLLIEDIPITRIVKFMKEKYSEEVSAPEISAYKKYFFNFKRKALEERLEILNNEKTSLESDLKLVSSNNSFSEGDKVVIQKQYIDRINTITKIIKDMNMMYTELAFKQGMLEHNDLDAIFRDIVNRGYRRFVKLDQYHDRDIVDPLTKIAKMMGYAADKISILENQAKGGKSGSKDSGGKVTIGDKHLEGTVMEFYQRRYDEVIRESINIKEEEITEDIGGIDEI